MDTTIETNGAVMSAEPVRRRRTGKKRLCFEVPVKMPAGVRELWRSAPSEDQERAHRTCVQILSLWLGKRPVEEVAAILSLPRLRVWQLSQQALSGMLAGLLKQPRRRIGAKEAVMGRSEDDPRTLKKRIAELEKKLALRDELVRLVAALPKPRTEPPDQPAAKTRRGAARSRGASSDRDVARDASPAPAG